MVYEAHISLAVALHTLILREEESHPLPVLYRQYIYFAKYALLL